MEGVGKANHRTDREGVRKANHRTGMEGGKKANHRTDMEGGMKGNHRPANDREYFYRNLCLVVACYSQVEII